MAEQLVIDWNARDVRSNGATAHPEAKCTQTAIAEKVEDSSRFFVATDDDLPAILFEEPTK